MKKNQVVQGVKLKGLDKVARIPIKVVPSTSVKRKPAWIRAKAPTGDRVRQLKARLRENNLFTVCEKLPARTSVNVFPRARQPS